MQHVESMETQEISANVTVETTPNITTTTVQQDLPPRGIYLRPSSSLTSTISSDLLLGRWRLSLVLFGRVFLEDVGMEPGSIISELGGFPVKEAKFRRHMEKLRNAQQKDLTLSKMERNRTSLITHTFKELNTHYSNHNRRIQPPLAFTRVKVTFKDEPGEGSGVARSFYTSIAEALLANEKLPNLESAQVGTNKYSVPSMLQRHRHRDTSGRRNTIMLTHKHSLWRPSRENRKTLNYDARPFRPVSSGGGSSSVGASNNENNFGSNAGGIISGSPSSSANMNSSAFSSLNDHLPIQQQHLGERLFPKVQTLHPNNAQRITGMLLELPPTQLLVLLASEETLRQKANEAMDIIMSRQRVELDAVSGIIGVSPISNNTNNIGGSSSSNNSASVDQQQQNSGSSSNLSKKINAVVVLDDCQSDDNAPLFYSPGKRGFYSPRQGYSSYERLNAFRNIGRFVHYF